MATTSSRCTADIVIVAVPWEGHAELLTDLRPRSPASSSSTASTRSASTSRAPTRSAVEEGSAAQQAAALLPDSTVCAAFHHVSASLLIDPEVATIDLDVLVLGEDREATAKVQALAGRIAGMRGIYAGRLRNAGQVEALTANLISINRRYKAHAGIRVTDL